MAEAFYIPALATIGTDSTIVQGNCYWLRYRNSSNNTYYKLAVASNIYGCIGALYLEPSGANHTLLVAGPSAGILKQVYAYDNGNYDSSYLSTTVNLSTGGVSGIGPYSGSINKNYSYDASSPYGIFSSATEARAAIMAKQAEVQIKYRLTNCSAPNAPTIAASGETVTVNLVPASGFQFMSPDDIYVENDGTRISSSFINNTLTFVMP